MNKRIRLYREGHVTNDGRLLKSTQWAAAPLPLLLRDSEDGHEPVKIIGTVTHLRHDRKTGWVTGVIKSSGNFPGLYPGADFDQIEVDEEETTDKKLVFKAARLRAVTLSEYPAWDGMDMT